MKSPVIEDNIAIDLSGKTLLIVEDDEFIFCILEVMLKDTGVGIIYAGNGEEAIGILEENPIDMILLDIRLPGQDGFEIFKKIKRRYTHIPVVAHTANCIPEEKEKFISAGFAGYLEKPINGETIRHLMHELIG